MLVPVHVQCACSVLFFPVELVAVVALFIDAFLLLTTGAHPQ